MPYAEPGDPEVPAIHRYIAVPNCDRLELTVEARDVETIRNVAIRPHPAFNAATNREEPRRNEAVYSRDTDFPGRWARIVDVQRARGQALARVEIYPVQFNPRQRTISCPREIRLHITPVNPRGPVTVNAGPLQTVLDAVVPNLGADGVSLGATTPMPLTSGGTGQVCWCNTGNDNYVQAANYIIGNCAADYLIIVADELSHGDDSVLVYSLATKRAEFNGFNVAIARMGQIDSTPTNTGTPDMMRAFVDSIYTSHSAGHMGDGRLGYLLLIGDAVNPGGHVILPTHYFPGDYATTNDNGSEAYFGLMDGTSDVVPDLLIGRLPVDADEDHWELGNLVGKLTTFEPISAAASWADRILMMSGGDDSGFSFAGEGLAGFQNYFDAIEDLFPSSGKTFVQMHRKAAASDSLFSKAVCDSMAHGFSVVGLFDHANPVSFANSFFPVHYDTLRNDSSPTLVLSIGSYVGFFDYLASWTNPPLCYTSPTYPGIPCKVPETPIDSRDVIAERLLVQPAGAVGVVAFGRSNGPPFAQQVFANAFRALLQHKLSQLGSLVLGTKLLTDDATTMWALNLLGDPALNVCYQFDSVALDSIDLAVSGLDLAFTSGLHDYAPSGSATMKVVVKNLWKDAAQSVPVEVWEGVPGAQGSSLLNDFTLSTVPAHGDTSWTGSIGSFSLGDHDIYVSVDPDNDLDDPVRTNNVSYRTLHVRDYAPGFPRELVVSTGNAPIEIADGILSTPGKLELMVGTRLYDATGDSLGIALAPLGNFLRSGKRHYIAQVPVGSSTQMILYEVDTGTNVADFPATGVVQNVIALDHGLPGGMLLALQTRDPSALENNICLYDLNGQMKWVYKIGDVAHFTFSFGAFVMGAGDVTGDGVSDVVYAFSPYGAADSLGVINGGTGGRVWTVATGDTLFGKAYLRIVDIQNDGTLEIVTNTRASGTPAQDRIQCYSANGSLLWQVAAGNAGDTFIAPADIDHDGVKEIIFAHEARLGVITISGSSATVSAEINLTGDRKLLSTPLAADIDGDDQTEIIVLCLLQDYLAGQTLELQVYEDDLTAITPTYQFPSNASSAALPLAAATGDIDGDGRIEVVFATFDGLLHAVRVGTSAGRVDWVSAEGGPMRTGLYEQVLGGTYTEPVAIINRARVLETATFGGGLTVTAPADVQVGASDSLVVEGSFSILGSAQDSVRVRIDDLAPAGSHWGGFIYGNAGTHGHMHHAVLTDALTAVEHKSPLDIRNSRITGITDAGVLSSDSLWVIGSSISGSGGDGIYISECCVDKVTLQGSLIETCDLIGVNSFSEGTLDVSNTLIRAMDIGIKARHGTVFLSNSAIEDCVTYGSYFAKDQMGVGVDGTSFTGSDVGLFISSETTATIDDCTFAHNTDGLWMNCDPSTDVEVHDCTADSNTTSGIYLVANDYVGSGSVLITRNTITHGAIGIYAHGASPEIRSHNTVQNNASGIKCDSNSHAVVESCTVNTNTYGINVLSGNPDIGHVSGGNSLGYNILKPNSTYHVRNDAGGTISAQRNYWPQNPPTVCYPSPSMLFGSVDSTAALCTQPSLSSPGFQVQGDGDKRPDVPTRFSLSPNYPNPFNPTTTVSFEVPRPSRVQVAVYDVTGGLVAVLLDETKTPGRYRIAWNGHDRHGQPVASGIYFLRMRAGSFVDTKKLLLLK